MLNLNSTLSNFLATFISNNKLPLANEAEIENGVAYKKKQKKKWKVGGLRPATLLKFFSNTGAFQKNLHPAGIYLFKVNNKNARTRCEICSKLTMKIPERRQSLLLTLNIFQTLF